MGRELGFGRDKVGFINMVKCSLCKTSGRRIDKCSTCEKGFHLFCLTRHQKAEACCLASVHNKRHNTCHRCQSLLNDNDKRHECSNAECKEVFCSKCIKSRYKFDLSKISECWECFVCLKTCSCKSCRKKAGKKIRKSSDFGSTELHPCHYCEKKMTASRLVHCEACNNYMCPGCSEQFFNKLEDCPICLDICTCSKCGDLRFNKDFPEFYKGVDLRSLYPYDLESIFFINGFWVRSINL